MLGWHLSVTFNGPVRLSILRLLWVSFQLQPWGYPITAWLPQLQASYTQKAASKTNEVQKGSQVFLLLIREKDNTCPHIYTHNTKDPESHRPGLGHMATYSKTVVKRNVDLFQPIW